MAKKQSRKPAITRDPATHSGAPVFTGTRIGVQVLLDYFEDGQTIEAFLSHYPGISREQATRALAEIGELLSTHP